MFANGKEVAGHRIWEVQEEWMVRERNKSSSSALK